MAQLSVLIPFTSTSAAAAAAFARQLQDSAQVILVGEGALDSSQAGGCQVIGDVVGKGSAIRQALPLLAGEVTVIQDPDPAYSTSTYPQLAAPIRGDAADAVFGARGLSGRPLQDRALSKFTQFITEAPLTDPLSGQRAFRTEALRKLHLTSTGEDIDAEIVVKLSAHLYRLAEVPIEVSGAPRTPASAHLQRARTLLRYATVQNDADNQHEGYNTLARMEGAPNYNAWIGRMLARYCGSRILEVGAGIGTITEQIEPGRELLIALEVDPFYVERLENRFRNKRHVRPMLTDVATADWKGLRSERLDTVVLTNVLEHIEDDVQALRNFRDTLLPGGRVVILVPALPALFGSMDEAVGHFRRYTPERLRAALEDAGFEIERLEWMNLAGIPGWWLNSRVFRRRAVPPLQLRLYDTFAPLLARAEELLPTLPIGMSLFAVGRAPETPR